MNRIIRQSETHTHKDRKSNYKQAKCQWLHAHTHTQTHIQTVQQTLIFVLRCTVNFPCLFRMKTNWFLRKYISCPFLPPFRLNMTDIAAIFRSKIHSCFNYPVSFFMIKEHYVNIVLLLCYIWHIFSCMPFIVRWRYFINNYFMRRRFISLNVWTSFIPTEWLCYN